MVMWNKNARERQNMVFSAGLDVMLDTRAVGLHIPDALMGIGARVLTFHAEVSNESFFQRV